MTTFALDPNVIDLTGIQPPRLKPPEIKSPLLPVGSGPLPARMGDEIAYTKAMFGALIAATADVEKFDYNMKQFNAILTSVEIEELKDE